MPADNVTVTAEFTAKEKTKPTDPTPPTPSTPSGPTPRPDLRIVKYVLLGEEGVIDEDDHTITVDIPLSKRPDDERATPDEVVKTRGDLTPSEDDSIPLDETVVYVLEDPETGTVKRYTMNIIWIDDTPDLRIVKYVLLGETGIIDDEKHTITVNIPLSKRPDDMRAVPDEVVYTAGILTPTADDAISLSSNVIYLLSYPATRATTTYLMTVNWIDDTPTPPDTPDEGNTPGDDGGDNGGNTPGDDGGDDDGGDDGDPGDKNPNTGASNTNLIFIALLACATITTFSSPRKERT